MSHVIVVSFAFLLMTGHVLGAEGVLRLSGAYSFGLSMATPEQESIASDELVVYAKNISDTPLRVPCGDLGFSCERIDGENVVSISLNNRQMRDGSSIPSIESDLRIAELLPGEVAAIVIRNLSAVNHQLPIRVELRLEGPAISRFHLVQGVFGCVIPPLFHRPEEPGPAEVHR